MCEENRKPGKAIMVDKIQGYTPGPFEDVEVVVPNRIGRDQYFMRIARIVAERGTCPRARVGAVIVDQKNRIMSAGYNGSPPGHPHCLDVACSLIIVDDKTYCIRTIHAEINAVLTLRSQDDNLSLYSTHQPCFDCMKVIAGTGRIARVVFQVEYRDPKLERMADEYKGIKLYQVNI